LKQAIINKVEKLGLSRPDYVERGKSANPECHERRRKEALIEYLCDCGYELDRDSNRGFANEYAMILRDTGVRHEPTLGDFANWADEFLYSGDAATESFVNFRFEQWKINGNFSRNIHRPDALEKNINIT